MPVLQQAIQVSVTQSLPKAPVMCYRALPYMYHVAMLTFTICLGAWSMSKDMREHILKRSPLPATGTDAARPLADGT